MKQIVMIEDNQDHALLIKRGVESKDCEVMHFEDGPTALKHLSEIRQMEVRPDLILLDLQLPGMNGFDILKKIRESDFISRVPVVMLTTSCRKEEIEKAYQLGANGYAVKSDDFDTFMKKLKNIKEYWFSTVELPYQQTLVKG